uniref:FHOD1 N-terminal GTPase-binding domain-containing protein n=1 Tax=Gasterosteus aculeatus aculeatus TaxID=481459 RepID=A0AAQ4Q0P6_GASAC
MASVVCRVQYLEDSDPFVCTNFPEPRRPPTVNVEENLPLGEQIAGIHKLLEAPLKLEDCTLQLSPLGNYLDLDLSLDEQRDELESFYQDVTKGKKPIMILRTQLSVRVHCILGPRRVNCVFPLRSRMNQGSRPLIRNKQETVSFLSGEPPPPFLQLLEPLVVYWRTGSDLIQSSGCDWITY